MDPSPTRTTISRLAQGESAFGGKEEKEEKKRKSSQIKRPHEKSRSDFVLTGFSRNPFKAGAGRFLFFPAFSSFQVQS